MKLKCPICSSEKVSVFLEKMCDDRFGFPEVYTICKCPICEHFYCLESLDSLMIRDLYEKYYGRKPETNLGFHSSLKSKTRRWIMGENNLGQFARKPSSLIKLLDVGSGDCQNLWDADFLGFNAFGFDVDSTSEEIGLHNGLQVRTGIKINDVFPEEKFDWVQLNQVIEHYIDPRDDLRNLAPHLRDEGCLFIATPNSGSIFRKFTGRSWINWHVPYHQHHFSKKSLRVLLESEGWEIVSSRTVTPLVWVVLQLRRVTTTVRPGEANVSWQQGSRRRGSRAFELLMLMALFAPIRVLDVVGQGDCQVVIAKRRR